MIEFPEVVRNRAIAEGHMAWIDELPATIRSLERDWSIEVGRVYDEEAPRRSSPTPCSPTAPKQC